MISRFRGYDKKNIYVNADFVTSMEDDSLFPKSEKRTKLVCVEGRTTCSVTVDGCPDSVMFALNNAAIHKGCPCMLSGFTVPDDCPYGLEMLIINGQTPEEHM